MAKDKEGFMEDRHETRATERAEQDGTANGNRATEGGHGAHVKRMIAHTESEAGHPGHPVFGAAKPKDEANF